MDRLPVKMLIPALVVALVLAAMLVPEFKSDDSRDRDVLVKLLGGTAEFAAEKAYAEADVYFHAGLREAHDHDHDHEHESPAEGLPLIGLIERLHDQTAPKEHRHVEGVEEKEVLPWFVMAVRLNPRHVDAWRTGAYWFFRTGDPERAEEFIDEGIRRNPEEYLLYLDRGILFYRTGQFDRAIDDLETAERLWKDETEDDEYNLRAIRTYLTHLRTP